MLRPTVSVNDKQHMPISIYGHIYLSIFSTYQFSWGHYISIMTTCSMLAYKLAPSQVPQWSDFHAESYKFDPILTLTIHWSHTTYVIIKFEFCVIWWLLVYSMLCLQIIKSNIKRQIQRIVSLVIADGLVKAHVNMLTLSSFPHYPSPPPPPHLPFRVLSLSTAKSFQSDLNYIKQFNMFKPSHIPSW